MSDYDANVPEEDRVAEPGPAAMALRWSVALACVAWAAWIVAAFAWRHGNAAGIIHAIRNNLPLDKVHWGLFEDYFSLLRPFNPRWGEIPWLEIAFGCGMVGVYAFIGHFIVSCVDIYVSRPMRLVLSYVFGLGVMSVLIELLTMAHLLYRVQLILLFVLTLVLFWYVSYRLNRRGGGAEPEHADMRFARASQVNLARQHFRGSLLRLNGFWARLTYGALITLTALITLLTFYHGIFFAETYWDSLILYLGYGRMTHLQHAFPFKAVAQVGYGLGANYPHLYPLVGATASQLWGSWHDVFAQVVPPWCALLTTIAIYCLVLELSRNRLAAALAALLFRAPLDSIAYASYASDYAVAILFTAAFLYLAWKYIESGLRGYFILATFVPPLAMHINYLMGILWLPWAVMLLAVHLRPRYHQTHLVEEDRLAISSVKAEMDLEFLRNVHTPTLRRFLGSRFFWAVLLAAVVVGSTWHIRNWVLTGNPVYAFFHGVFGGVNYNQEVMDSADLEWLINGDGIGGHALGSDLKHPSLATKLKVSWSYWFYDFKLAPVFLAFAVPALLIWLIQFIAAFFHKPRAPDHLYVDDVARISVELKFGAVAFVLVVGLLAFHYLLGDYYLYQILPMMPAYCVAVWFLYDVCRPRVARALLLALGISVGLLPGLPFALRGMKATAEDARLDGQRIFPHQLYPLRNPGISADDMRRLRYGHDVDMWIYVNNTCTSATVLTHENRQLVFDSSITLFHLDEPEIVALWGKSRAEKLEALKTMTVKESDGSEKTGVQYYLYLPNERSHAVNRRLGVQEWLNDETVMTEIFTARPPELLNKPRSELTEDELKRCNRLFRFNWTAPVRIE